MAQEQQQENMAHEHTIAQKDGVVTGKVTQRYYTKGISIKVGTKYFWALGILDQGAHGDAEVLHGGTSILDLRRPRV